MPRRPPPDPHPVLELSHVRLSPEHGEEFDYRVEAGEITVVLGANRSGKTDLCRLIAGLPTAAHGNVVIAGEDVSSWRPAQRPVSMVYQAYVNYPNLTVAENIASPLRARGLAARERSARTADLAATLGISDLLDRLPQQLSGGQQQRVAIARALAKDARVLLLDEPLVNLDFKLRETLEAELRSLLLASNVAVIYTSSSPRDALTLGDRVLLLEQARLEQSGTPLDVYRRPKSLLSMELMAEPQINRFEEDGRTCALRPEHVQVTADASDESLLKFEMQVSAYETDGDESFIHGSVGRFDWVVRSRGMHSVTAGTTIGLSASRRDVVSF